MEEKSKEEVVELDKENAQDADASDAKPVSNSVWMMRAQSLEEQVKKQAESVDQEKEKALRALAELENFKKRKEQEVETFKKFMMEKAALDMLPVLDSFDRACDHLNGETSEQTKGFLMIQKQFHTAMEKWGVQPLEALQQPFDPNQHQAVMEEEVAGIAPGIVVKEMQKGYKLHDRVIRPTMVVVSK